MDIIPRKPYYFVALWSEHNRDIIPLKFDENDYLVKIEGVEEHDKTLFDLELFEDSETAISLARDMFELLSPLTAGQMLDMFGHYKVELHVRKIVTVEGSRVDVRDIWVSDSHRCFYLYPDPVSSICLKRHK